ncbi:hypothetical protein HYH02_013214 [Chlamydomonas schloesseri]|uniref:Uncharacterized protein n=1 Tax=Chlamydomonas schloesseri TaxID=2026947 RepID=A0A835VW69_9CHLO|nr:hypothetical protein HYH02_013214 [Chlamydomonas schloesseri]|eukprot:KAG2431637.1 hypothetical protein HYH02_013214 [Chlamydomonas schloesseri]
MAATGGVQFLQSSVEDQPKALGAYKAGNTEMIRKMLRDQQRETQALHGNPLFKEFRGAPGGVRQNKFGKGYAVPDDGSAPPALTDPKSLEYEGQSRMFDLIKNTAAKEEKKKEGVWASFGQPYVPLGDPQELQKWLPELNRDKMGSGEGGRSGPRRKPRYPSQPPPQQQQGQGQGQQGPGGQRGGSKARRDRPVSVGSAYESEGGMGGSPATGAGVGDGDEGSPGGGSAGGGAVSAAEAAIRAATQEAEDTLNKHKSVMRFTIHDRTEAVFPAAVLRNANMRSSKAKASAGAFVNRREAEEEAADPTRAYGQPPLPRKHLAPLPGPGGRRGGGGGSGEEGGGGADPSSFFLTQQGQQAAAAAGQAAQDEERRMMSLDTGGYTTSPSGGGAFGGGDGTGLFTAGGGINPGDGAFQPIVEPVVPLRGDEANPVYRWHNDFVAARQAGRTQLQSHLYGRAQGRHAVRTDASSAAGMSTTLFSVLNLSQGRMPTQPTGNKVVSPYSRLEAFQAAQEAARRNTKQKAVAALDPAEIRILQRFYDQLCALVEAQRMSDPLCLMVVAKVKALLEAGVYLHRPMLTAVVEHVAAFAHGAGMMRYNKFLLAVLTFITKCVGLEAADLEEEVERHGVAVVVYGTPVAPSKVTADMLPGGGGGAAAGGGGGGGEAEEAAGGGAGKREAGHARSGRGGGGKGAAAGSGAAGAAALQAGGAAAAAGEEAVGPDAVAAAGAGAGAGASGAAAAAGALAGQLAAGAKLEG